MKKTVKRRRSVQQLTLRVDSKLKRFLSRSASQLGVKVSEMLRPIIEEAAATTIPSLLQRRQEAFASSRKLLDQVPGAS